jgi:hypothetical protein
MNQLEFIAYLGGMILTILHLNLPKKESSHQNLSGK